MALNGIKVLEFAGYDTIGFCGMILADFGASVTRIDRVALKGFPLSDSFCRGKRSIALNLRDRTGLDIVKKLSQNADVLLESSRPGVMESMGLGPSTLLGDNCRLIYARLTGYGQDGPYKNLAGHNLNYASVNGILSRLQYGSDISTLPVSLLTAGAGGGLSCAFGISLALFERERTGLGQVIDASMLEGAAYASSFLFTSRGDKNFWTGEKNENFVFDSSPFYGLYETYDHIHMAVCCLEPKFVLKFLSVLKLSVDNPSSCTPGSQAAADLRNRLVELFKTKNRDEWVEVFAAADCCVTPVLDADETAYDPHLTARTSFRPGTGLDTSLTEPAPAPRLSTMPASEPKTRPTEGEHTREILKELKYTEDQIEELIKENVISCSSATTYRF